MPQGSPRTGDKEDQKRGPMGTVRKETITRAGEHEKPSEKADTGKGHKGLRAQGCHALCGAVSTRGGASLQGGGPGRMNSFY